jgi:chaperonin cofactor prefoldin
LDDDEREKMELRVKQLQNEMQKRNKQRFHMLKEAFRAMDTDGNGMCAWGQI